MNNHHFMKMVWPFPLIRLYSYCPFVDKFIEDMLFDENLKLVKYDTYNTTLKTSTGQEVELWTPHSDADVALNRGYVNGKLKWNGKMPSRWVVRAMLKRIEKLRWE